MIVRSTALALPLRDECVDLIITSPPYFALRSYRDGDEHYDGQIGSEETPGDFVNALLEATKEMARVLKPTGSIFVNLGDKYAGSGGHNNNGLGKSGLINSKRYLDGRSDQGASRRNAPDRYNQSSVVTIGRRIDKREQRYVTGEVPKKSLMGLPWRYALGCIDQLGLILRAEIIWSKPNGLPESVNDRVRRSHEQWFHMVKQGQYFASVDALRERTQGRPGLTWAERKERDDGTDTRARYSDQNGHGGSAGMADHPLGRLPGSVWTIATEPLIIPDGVRDHYNLPDHYAAFPTEWPRRLILGWSPEGGLVLDPFGGTGTVAMVARALGRIGLNGDCSFDYCRLARWRMFESGHAGRAEDRTWAERQGTLDLGATGDERGDHVGGRPVEVVSSPVITGGGPGVGVPGEDLHVPQGHPGVERGGDGAVPQAVGRDPLRDPGRLADPGDDPGGVVAGHPTAVLVQEDRPLTAPFAGHIDRSEHPAEFEAAKRAWAEMDARHCSVILDYEALIKTTARELYALEVRRQSMGWEDGMTERLVALQHKLVAALDPHQFDGDPNG